MSDPSTGLPVDWLAADGTRAAYTSSTNVGMYLWAVVGARDIGLIAPAEACTRVARTLTTLEGLERSHGFFYNWYDPATGDRLRTWPDRGDRVYGFLSTVDNGWLAAALVVVANAVPQLRDRANALLEPMDFGLFYDERIGQMFGGAWTETPPDRTYAKGDLLFTCFHYGTLNTEPRISSYIGIARGQLPPEHYFRLVRTFQPACDRGRQQMQPQGVTRAYLGVDVFEGTYAYAGGHLVPTWGGSMFEALMVTLVVPEETWGPRSWGMNHPLYVRAQEHHGLDEAGYGFWGFSSSANPAGGYREYGVTAIGLNPDGRTSDEERAPGDDGLDSCPGCGTTSTPVHRGQGVVTPHASFLALRYDKAGALANLQKLETSFEAYGELGFYDAVNVLTGDVSRRYLALDQGMIMAALTNALTDDQLRRWFIRGDVRAAIQPLLGIETFESRGEVGLQCTTDASPGNHDRDAARRDRRGPGSGSLARQSGGRGWPGVGHPPVRPVASGWLPLRLCGEPSSPRCLGPVDADGDPDLALDA